MNTSYKTIDGIQYMPQTTVNWTIEIAPETIRDVTVGATIIGGEVVYDGAVR